MKPRFRLDTAEFKRTFREYSRVCKSRTFPEMVNNKAYYVARRAIFETPKADAKQIKGQLGKFVTRGRGGNKHKVAKLAQGRKPAPLVAMILNARRGRKGLKGLYGAAMELAAEAFLAARLRSVAFLKSGWLPAVRTLASFIGRGGGPPMGTRPKEFGRPKGKATPAREGWRVRATIENSAGDNKKNHAALLTFGAPALQRAFDNEAASMRQYIEDHLGEATRASGIKTK